MLLLLLLLLMMMMLVVMIKVSRPSSAKSSFRITVAVVVGFSFFSFFHDFFF